MEQLVNFIIRPPRAEYNPKHDLLDQEFMLRRKWYQRKDIELKNNRGDVLQCSHYVPIVSPEEKPLPCVIYCHGNSGCRADASEAAIMLLPSNITVFTLDFSGSGLSGGEHVTLGWHEKDDLKVVVDYLRQDGNVSLIGLWGRSMGAVTSLMYGAEDPSIAGMVLDSPFSDLVDLMMELVDTYKFRFPKFTVKFAIQYMRKVVQKKAKFDITDLNTIKVAKACFVPALFGHAIDDDFIQPHHSDRIYEAYMGDKNIIKFEGDHNSPRPKFYFDSINIFFHNVLHPPEDEVGESYFDPVTNYFDKDSWSTVNEVGDSLDFSVASKEPSSSHTDAGKQVRPKRPMSRMELICGVRWQTYAFKGVRETLKSYGEHWAIWARQVPSDIPSKSNQSEAKGREFDDNYLPSSSSSSSNMISFELADGNPYGPHVPTATEDDRYVEYQLDDLTGFPCDVEEEERLRELRGHFESAGEAAGVWRQVKMLMEAVIASLKDLETQQPSAEEKQASVDSTTDQSSQKDCNFLETVAIEHNPSPDPSVSAGTSFDKSAATVESGSATTSSRSETSGSVQSSTDTDLSSNTKVTLTVERNPENRIMDGLLRRWDFGFFRNNR